MPAKKTDASTKINKTPIKTKKTALKKAAKGRVKTTKKPAKLMEFSKSENIKIYCIGKTNNTGVVEIPKYDSICINKCLDLYNNTIPNLFP